MHRIDGAGHLNNLFVAEDPATNRPPTEFTPEWFNAVQEEIAAVIEAAGVSLDKGDNTQLATVLLALFVKNSQIPILQTDKLVLLSGCFAIQEN